jgi:hypothetical protein
VYDSMNREAYPPLDTFFADSMAYDIGVSRRTFQNLLPTLGWIKRLDFGFYGTCASSARAYGESRRQNDRRHIDRTAWSVSSTDCSSGTVKI